MARARAIDTRLERLIPAVEELFVAGVLDRDEINEMVRLRLAHEYKLVARPLLLVDVYNAINFELNVESRVCKRAASLGISNAMPHHAEKPSRQKDTKGKQKHLAKTITLRHRWAWVERVEHIYQTALRCFRKTATTGLHVSLEERAKLKADFIDFMLRFERKDSLSRHYAESVRLYPNDGHVWVAAAKWEMAEGRVDNARSLLQQAMANVPLVSAAKEKVGSLTEGSAHAAVWSTALRLELEFVAPMVRQLRKDTIREAAAILVRNKCRESKDSVKVETRNAKLLADQCDPEEAVIAMKAACEAKIKSLSVGNEAMAQIILELALAQQIIEGATGSTGAADPPTPMETLRRLIDTCKGFPFAGRLGLSIVQAGASSWWNHYEALVRGKSSSSVAAAQIATAASNFMELFSYALVTWPTAAASGEWCGGVAAYIESGGNTQDIIDDDVEDVRKKKDDDIAILQVVLTKISEKKQFIFGACQQAYTAGVELLITSLITFPFTLSDDRKRLLYPSQMAERSSLIEPLIAVARSVLVSLLFSPLPIQSLTKKTKTKSSDPPPHLISPDHVVDLIQWAINPQPNGARSSLPTSKHASKSYCAFPSIRQTGFTSKRVEEINADVQCWIDNHLCLQQRLHGLANAPLAGRSACVAPDVEQSGNKQVKFLGLTLEERTAIACGLGAMKHRRPATSSKLLNQINAALKSVLSSESVPLITHRDLQTKTVTVAPPVSSSSRNSHDLLRKDCDDRSPAMRFLDGLSSMQNLQDKIEILCDNLGLSSSYLPDGSKNNASLWPGCIIW